VPSPEKAVPVNDVGSDKPAASFRNLLSDGINIWKSPAAFLPAPWKTFHMAEESDADAKVAPTTSEQARPPSSRIKILLLALLVLVTVLALALGLGLGLGLKHHGQSGNKSGGSSTGNSTTSSSEGPSFASFEVQAWREQTLNYSLDLATWDFNAAPTTRVYNFTLTEGTGAPDGKQNPSRGKTLNSPSKGVNRTILLINGQYPGPLVRMNRGDRLLVNVTNQMSNATTVHWHGMVSASNSLSILSSDIFQFQNGTNWMDGTSGITQCPIPAGSSFLYNFTVENQFGTYWYHSHYVTQYMDGIVGPLVVHAPEEVQMQRELYDFDQVVLISDWYHDLTSGLLVGYLASGTENVEPVPDNGLIQGENYFNCSSYGDDSGYDCSQDSNRPVFSFEDGKRYRLRFINTGGFATFQVSVDNHTLQGT
jgi:FtsP/CotA-like multicopper oxidase with cupredoxin domain